VQGLWCNGRTPHPLPGPTTDEMLPNSPSPPEAPYQRMRLLVAQVAKPTRGVSPVRTPCKARVAKENRHQIFILPNSSGLFGQYTVLDQTPLLFAVLCLAPY
jgi:hypothetical protein